MKLGLTKFAIDLNRQGLIQDLNLSHGTNVVSFMRVTNAVGDPRYAGWGGGGWGRGGGQCLEWFQVVKKLVF